MEARDLSEIFKERVDHAARGDLPAEPLLDGAETQWGWEDSDFFVMLDGERFIVFVAKIEGDE